MLSENDCKIEDRFIISFSNIPDNLIEKIKIECEKRYLKRDKDEYYYKFLNWVRSDNEIVLYTQYAYADLKLPKYYNFIFNLNNLNETVNSDFKIVQSVFEGFFPLNSIEHGHKHIVIIKFEKNIPKIFNRLCIQNDFNCEMINDTLGFCLYNDYENIKSNLEKLK